MLYLAPRRRVGQAAAVRAPDYQAPGFVERVSYQLMLFERLGAARGLGHWIADVPVGTLPHMSDHICGVASRPPVAFG